MSNRYHYTGCGLDYVYLYNGFSMHETEYGQGVSIDDADRLNAAIAHYVISSPTCLCGQEVRFLRSMLDLSQAGLARHLGTKRLTVARWEAKPNTAIPGTADRALRLFFALKFEGDKSPLPIIDLMDQITGAEHSPTFFAEESGDWRHKKAA